VTEHDPELDLSSAARQGRVVLVADASAEGETIASSLRARGFAVLDVPLALLESRVAGEQPAAIVVDVDEPGACEAVERVRELASGAAAEVVCVGDLIRAAELGLASAFERPVDVPALCAHLERVTRPAEPRRRPLTTSPPPALARRERRTTSPPSRRDAPAAPPPLARWPSGSPGDLPSFAAAPAIAADDAAPGSDPLDIASLLPGLGGGLEIPDVPPGELSPDLAALLSAAEQRVLAHGGPSSSSLPPDDLDLVLPADMLALLDEPLEAEDEGAGTGGTGSSGPPATRGGTGAHARDDLVETAAGRAAAAHAGEPREGTAAHEPAAAAAHSSSPRTESHAGFAPSPAESTSALFEPRTGPGTGAGLGAGMLGDEPAGTPAPVDRSSSTRPPPHAEPEATEPPAGTWTARTPPPFMVRVMPLPGGEAHLPPLGGRRTERLELTSPALTPAPSPVSAGSGAPTAPTAHHATSPGSSGTGAFAHGAPPVSAAELGLPAVLGEGDAIRALARAIAGRVSGSLALEADAGPRRIVLHEGDVVTAGSGIAEESLVAFLAERGDLEHEVAARLAGKLPPFGRHAGAALVAHGHLGQDELWPVLRAHAEWLIGRAAAEPRGTCELEDEPPGRLKAEPSVFGGATGAEVLVETARRVIAPGAALGWLGGPTARLEDGPHAALVGECALDPDEAEAVRAVRGRTVGEVMTGHEPELANVLYALAALGVLDARAEARPAGQPPAPSEDPLDEEALRQRVRARLALVEDGDYFALLGVPRASTSYEIRRAYVALRRALEPHRVLTAATADLADDLRLILEVLDEAYEVLREPHRRERYRRAIEAGPP
jgi:hypothetical protein